MTTVLFEMALFATSVSAAAVAAVAGFGIGSLITPVLSLSVETKIAIAVVSVPHFIATSMRFWMLRRYVNKQVLLGFGLTSAAGGLFGALLHGYFESAALTLVFGLILIFAGFMGSTGLSEKLRFRGIVSWVAGGVSGFLGGMVGNQGGIRAAALFGFKISKESFVASATAVGLIVDVARMPVYFWTESSDLFANGRWLSLTSLGVILGTFLGTRLLKSLPERMFKGFVSFLILILGIYMTYKGLGQS